MPSMRMSVSSKSALLSSSALLAASALSTPTGWQPIIFRPSISVRTIRIVVRHQNSQHGTPYENG